jgi:hypothetical protein
MLSAIYSTHGNYTVMTPDDNSTMSGANIGGQDYAFTLSSNSSEYFDESSRRMLNIPLPLRTRNDSPVTINFNMISTPIIQRPTFPIRFYAHKLGGMTLYVERDCQNSKLWTTQIIEVGDVTTCEIRDISGRDIDPATLHLSHSYASRLLAPEKRDWKVKRGTTVIFQYSANFKVWKAGQEVIARQINEREVDLYLGTAWCHFYLFLAVQLGFRWALGVIDY